MAGETDRLVQLCREAAALHDPTEYDVVVASGEQVTAGLLAMTLQNMGLKARSFMGWQLVRASGVHGNARVEAVECATLDEALSGGTVAVIPGFQGVSTTAGWRRSAAADRTRRRSPSPPGVKADRCDIYTDVDGVYTTDPRIVPRARKLDQVTFEEMLELAGVGAKVLQVRSVGLAMRENLPLRVLSAFEDKPGTDIVAELSGADMERNLIAGIAADRNEARITLTGVPDQPGTVAAGDRPDRRGRHPGRHDRPRGDAEYRLVSDLTFTVPRASLAQAMAVIEQRKDDDRLCRAGPRRCGRQGQHRRRRHPLQPAARRDDVRDAGRAADQPARGLDQRDQGQRADRRSRARPCGARAPHRLRPRCGAGGMSGEGLIAEPRAVHASVGHARLKELMHRGTEFLGCDVAIMGGAMSWISERHLVAAISNAGGFGVIACGAMSPELLDTEIAETKARTDRPFGVNLITMHPQLSRADRRLREARGRPCRARRRLPAGRRDRADQGAAARSWSASRPRSRWPRS